MEHLLCYHHLFGGEVQGHGHMSFSTDGPLTAKVFAEKLKTLKSSRGGELIIASLYTFAPEPTEPISAE